MPRHDPRALEALVTHRWSSIDATLDGLRAIDGWGRRHADPRGAFAAAYAIVTAAVAEAQRRGAFSEPAWTDAVVLDFAERYRVALLAAARDEPAPAWEPALRCSRGSGLVPIVALIHAMIAHIHYDLPHSLAACAPIDTRRVADYEHLGAVICGATREIQRVLLDGYAPELRGLHEALGGADTWITNAVVRAWRSRALSVALRMGASTTQASAWSRWLALECIVLARGVDALTWPARQRALVRRVSRRRSPARDARGSASAS